MPVTTRGTAWKTYCGHAAWEPGDAPVGVSLSKVTGNVDRLGNKRREGAIDKHRRLRSLSPTLLHGTRGTSSDALLPRRIQRESATSAVRDLRSIARGRQCVATIIGNERHTQRVITVLRFLAVSELQFVSDLLRGALGQIAPVLRPPTLLAGGSFAEQTLGLCTT